ncbi:MAG: J domain-containing protein [Spirochaetaceae bacterium]|nr:J domain-containing protein [Spirochaetaceae bacterium]MBO4729346.1 J domain-containing protein [Spirochaetaceae bacterium]
MIGSSFRTKSSAYVNSRVNYNSVPRELYKDFRRLGLAPGASLAVCKSAQRNLMKIHHPDRHAESRYSFYVATQITSTINEAFQRIEVWYTKGKLDD